MATYKDNMCGICIRVPGNNSRSIGTHTDAFSYSRYLGGQHTQSASDKYRSASQYCSGFTLHQALLSQHHSAPMYPSHGAASSRCPLLYFFHQSSTPEPVLIFFCICSTPYSSASAVGGQPGT